ncbi:MAG: tail fiber domain-containing protein [Chitinispirillaceae bacterium]|nr:tail fiber domain-containing protein [Chitinispirillaceae bacterium]
MHKIAILLIFSLSILFAQSKSAIQFYDTTGASKTCNSDNNTASSSERLSISGNICASGSITGASTSCFSDRRFKTKVKPLDSVIEKVKRLQGVSYLWDTVTYPDRHFPGDEQIGLIAQEVETVFPQLVHTGSDGFKSIFYDKLTAVLIEATRKQQEKIEDLTAVVSDLKKADEYKAEIITKQGIQIEELYFKVLGMENKVGR